MAVFFILAVFYFVHRKEKTETTLLGPAPTAPAMPDPFASLMLEAKSSYVLDIATGQVLYDKDGETVYPLASITKLMSILVASKILTATSTVLITPEAIDQTGDNGLLTGELWDFQKLTAFTLVTSSNDGIYAIAEAAGAYMTTPTTTDPVAAFVDHMNKTAQTIGLPDMRFYNPSGLDVDDTTSGGYGSAKDVAELVSYIVKNHPDLLAPTTESKISISSDVTHHVGENTDESLPDIPAAIASKTGNTDLAGGNLVVIFDAGLMHPVVAVVLGSSYDGRFIDMNALASTTVEYLSNASDTIAR